MFENTWRRLRQRYTWLDPKHPLAIRDARWTYGPLPLFFQRFTNIWAILGYAALIHGGFFIIAILTYNHLGSTIFSAFTPMLAPFLTPFGIPIAAGFIHTLLYWGLLIGACNQASKGFAGQFVDGSWRVLRLTPYSAFNLMMTKVLTLWRNWSAVLNVLFWLRVAALVAIPVSSAALRGRELATTTAQNVGGIAVFLAQPYADLLMVIGLSVLVSTLIHDVTWARFFAYGLSGLAVGGLSLLVCMLLTFTSPLGPISGMFVPMGHWAALATVALPPLSPSTFDFQIVALSVLNILIPVLIGVIALAVTYRLAKSEIGLATSRELVA